MVYFDRVFETPANQMADEMEEIIPEEIFQSLQSVVGTGLSGSLFAAKVHSLIDKQMIIVRKDDDKSNHSGSKIEYTGMPGKWILVDDFIDSGATVVRVLKKVKDIFSFPGDLNYYRNFQGVYCYGSRYGEPRFKTPLELSDTYDRIGKTLFGGDKAIFPERLEDAKWYGRDTVRTSPVGGWTTIGVGAEPTTGISA